MQSLRLRKTPWQTLVLAMALALISCRRDEEPSARSSTSVSVSKRVTAPADPSSEPIEKEERWRLTFGRQVWPLELIIRGTNVSGSIIRGKEALVIEGTLDGAELQFTFRGSMPDELSDGGSSLHVVHFTGSRDDGGFTGRCVVRREVARGGKLVPLEETTAAVLRQVAAPEP